MDEMEKIRQLVSLVSDKELAELELEEDNFRVKIKNQGGVQYLPAPSSHAGHGYQQMNSLPAGQKGEELSEDSNDSENEDEGLVEIMAPMVGTLYRSPNEGTDAYVTLGDTVEPDTVVCIVEAMKVMNEVKAGVSGVVEEILVQNAEPVEYNQVLFLVRPSESPTEG